MDYRSGCSMRKVIDYVLEYREEGLDCSASLSIDFISNYVIREYNEIMAVVYEVKKDWHEFLLKIEVRKKLYSDDAEKEKIELIEKEIVDLSEKLKKSGEGDFFKRRLELIKKILKDNGIEDEKFYSFEFWDQCVSPDVLLEFLDTVVWKDMDKKKVM